MDGLGYFHIPKEKLGKRNIFPFQIFIFNPENKKYSTFLLANSPLTKDMAIKLERLLTAGGAIAISEKQRLTFQRTLKIKKDDPIYKTPIPQPPIQKVADKKAPSSPEKTKLKELDSNTKETISKELSNNNYLMLIEMARKEIESFSLSTSQMVSLAVHLSGKFLIKDSKLTRTLVLSYFLARVMNISDEEELSALVCAAFFTQIGMVSLSLRMSRIDRSEYDQEDLNNFHKYPSLSLHLCRKAKIEMTDIFQQIILDHQERFSGNGFPSNKKESEVSDLSLIVGLATYIVEYFDMELSLKEIFSQHETELRLEFSEKIVNNFLEMLNTKSFSQAA